MGALTKARGSDGAPDPLVRSLRTRSFRPFGFGDGFRHHLALSRSIRSWRSDVSEEKPARRGHGTRTGGIVPSRWDPGCNLDRKRNVTVAARDGESSAVCTNVASLPCHRQTRVHEAWPEASGFLRPVQSGRAMCSLTLSACRERHTKILSSCSESTRLIAECDDDIKIPWSPIRSSRERRSKR